MTDKPRTTSAEDSPDDDAHFLQRLQPSRLILPIVIGLGVVGFMFWRSYRPGDLAPLAHARYAWLLVTLGVLLARDFGYIYRIRHIAERELSYRQSLDVIMIWEFASCVLPSAVGGTAVASFILNKEGITLGKSLAYVMVTALMDNLYYVLMVPLVVLIAGAGLYPHEKKHIHLYLPVSVGLFLAGAMLCQFVVLPGAVKALLGFNSYVDLDPDLRLNEWLGFAIMLPLVFGVSFQTPLVMFFLNRIGLFTAEMYWRKWRYAVFILAAFSAVITPTPDAVTMLYLFVPMFGLYVIGVLVCYYFPPRWQTHPVVVDETQVAV